MSDEPRGDDDVRTDNKLSRAELREVRDGLRLRAAVVYQIIREEGEEELGRSISGLWWSGLAAGLSIGFSIVAKALLATYLPDAPWRPLVDSLGYSVGFLIVILAREQLFTENTLTAVLPLAAERTWKNLYKMLRLWAVVFAANMVGTMIFAAGLSLQIFFPEAVREAFVAAGHHILSADPPTQFLRAILAGWLIATLVWLLPSAEGARFWVIILITYLIALGGLAHVVAGSVEAFLLLFLGEIGLGTAVFGFLLPALLGNIVGGSALFALIAYAQVKEEI